MAEFQGGAPTRQGVRLSPGESIQSQPWAFVGMTLAAGLAVGLLWRVKTVRKALRLYLLVQRFI